MPHPSSSQYCLARRHNGTIPDLSDRVQLRKWQLIEFAKHRLDYSLIQWRLPLQTRNENPRQHLVFPFFHPARRKAQSHDGTRKWRDHDRLTGADDVERESRRLQMGEPLSDLLGHSVTKSGITTGTYWLRDGNQLEQFRAVFCDGSRITAKPASITMNQGRHVVGKSAIFQPMQSATHDPEPR